MYQGDNYKNPEPDLFWGFYYPIGRTHWGIEFSNIIDLAQGIYLVGHNRQRLLRQLVETLGQQVQRLYRSLNWQLLDQDISIDNLLKLFKAPEFHYGIIHLNYHVLSSSKSGTEQICLGLTEQEEKLVIDLETELILSRGGFRNLPFVFLNACLSAAGTLWERPTFSLPIKMLRFGAGGVIATVCPVPENFANAFASKFYEFLFAQLSSDKRVNLGEVLVKTRRFFLERYNNPLGLAYILYGLSNLHLHVETQESQSTATGVREKIAKPQNIYRLVLDISQSQLFVAQRSQLTVALQPTTSEQDSIQIPENTAELYCFINADGLHLANNTLPITFDPKTGQPIPANFELQAHLRGDRPYTVQLFLQNPDSGRVQIYETCGQIKVIPPEVPPERFPILPPLNIRVTRKPDLILHVETYLPDGEAGYHYLRYYFTTRLPTLRLREEPVGQVELSCHDLSRLRALVATTLQQNVNLSPADSREQLISLGTYLFDRLFPPDKTASFHETFWQIADRLSTCLIVEDEVSWMPWEQLVPYRHDETESLSFLGERCQLSRWVEGLGSPRYDEIPLGDLAIAQYKFFQPEQQEQMGRDEQLTGWQRLLGAAAISQGLQPAVTPDNSVYAVHLLRYSSDLAREREIVPRGEIAAIPASGEPEVRQARLNLRLKRPLVTPIRSQPRADGGYWLLPERVLPFLRAGASAVIAPWWETAEKSDRLFWSHFYQLFRQCLPLGEAVWRSRLAVRRACPHTNDWLAYTLFGDPCARAYEPEPSEGYAAVECLNPDEPLHSGKTYYFRASLRNRPPVWYTDRLIEPEELPQQLQALFMAPGLQTNFPKPLAMQPVGNTMRQATIDLTPTAPGNYPLLVQLLEGDELVKRLQLNLEVRG